MGVTGRNEGGGKGGVKLDGAAPVPALEASFDLAKVQAAPLLHDVMDFDRLRGNANGNVAVTAHGKSERELIANLGGKGALQFLNGAIKGINIGALIRNPAGTLIDPASQKDQETDFSEMSGTFTITNGILKNTDLELKAPLLRVGGALVDWRGRRAHAEERAADTAAAELGMRRAEVRRVRPFEGALERHLHVFVKISATPERFPRRPGVARKRPLGV